MHTAKCTLSVFLSENTFMLWPQKKVGIFSRKHDLFSLCEIEKLMIYV